MFDARDGALERRQVGQPIGSTLCLRVERGEHLDTNKEREQPASDFRFHGGGQMFFWGDKKIKAPIRRGQMLFCSMIMNNTRQAMKKDVFRQIDLPKRLCSPYG